MYLIIGSLIAGLELMLALYLIRRGLIVEFAKIEKRLVDVLSELVQKHVEVSIEEHCYDRLRRQYEESR